MLHHILKEQGYDGKPHVCSKKELDEYVKNGELELYRGVEKTEHAKAFAYGELYAGKGLFGNGTYAAAGKGALEEAKIYSDPEGKNIIRMTLKKDANIKSYNEVVKAATKERESYQKKLQKELERAQKTGDYRQFDRIYAAVQLCSNPGRWAAAKGIDAILVPAKQAASPTGSDYIVILNRTAVRVQEIK